MLDSAFEYFRFVEIYTASLIASRIWIPGQARNDKLLRTYVVMHRMRP